LFSLPIILSVPSHPLFPLSPLPPSPNLSKQGSSLQYTYHLLASLLYQLHTTPASCNSWDKRPSLQWQKYTQTHTRAAKPSNPHNSQPTHPLLFTTPLLYFCATFTNSP
jgi:hypothetical protein